MEKNKDFQYLSERETVFGLLAKYENYKTGDRKKTFYQAIDVAGGFIIPSVLNLGYKRKTDLHWVKICFATHTFDRIEKDEKAHFEARLSAIGGTMGLLTGFSIISGVEVIYFAVKICCGFFSRKMIKM